MANALIGDPYAASNGLANSIAQTAQVLFAPNNDADSQMKAFYYRTLADQAAQKAGEGRAKKAYADILRQGVGSSPDWVSQAAGAAAESGTGGEDFARMLAGIVANTVGTSDDATLRARVGAGYSFPSVDQGVSMEDLQNARRQFFGNKLAVQGLENQGRVQVQGLKNQGDIATVQATPLTESQVKGAHRAELWPSLTNSERRVEAGILNQPKLDIYQTPQGQTVRIDANDPNAPILPTVGMMQQPEGPPQIGPLDLQPFQDASGGGPTSEMRNNADIAMKLGIDPAELALLQQANNASRSGMRLSLDVMKQIDAIQQKIATHVLGMGAGAPQGASIVQAPPPGSVPVQ